MDRIIEIKVSGNYLTKDNRVAGVKGEANVTFLRLCFDEGWKPYAKTVTFWNALGLDPVKRSLTADYFEDITKNEGIYLIPIPAEPLAHAGMMSFVIDGYLGGKRQRSIADKLEVKDAPITDNAMEPSDPTPTQAEQLQVQIDSIIDTIHNTAQAEQGALEAKEAAENAEQGALSAKDAAVLAQNNAISAEGSALGASNSAAASALSAEQAKSGALAAQAATQAAKNEALKAKDDIINMTVSSETLAPGAQATVQKNEIGGVVSLHFGIPEGKKGDKGDKGNVMYAVFDIDLESGQLEMTTPDEYDGAVFNINNGFLEVEI